MNKWYPQRNTTDAPIALLKSFIHQIEFPISRMTIEADVTRHPEFPSLSFNALVELFKNWGIEVIVYNWFIERISEVPTPSITFIHDEKGGVKLGLFVLYNDVNNGKVEYLHPRKGWVLESPEEFEQKWGKAFVSIKSITGQGEEDYEEKEVQYEEEKRNHPNSGILNVIDHFLTKEECDYLIRLSEDKFERSKVYAKGDEIINGRTSYSAELIITDDVVLENIRERAAELVNLPKTHFEFFQCVSYGVGEEYQNHHDTFDVQTEEGRKVVAEGGQRKYTLLVYLNDGFIGGGTHFPELDIMVEPKNGRVALFENIDDNNDTIQASLHAGLPVTSGKKFALNIWVRNKPVVD